MPQVVEAQIREPGLRARALPTGIRELIANRLTAVREAEARIIAQSPMAAGFTAECPHGVRDYSTELSRLLGDEVPKMADLGLADAVVAWEALLDASGIPCRSQFTIRCARWRLMPSPAASVAHKAQIAAPRESLNKSC